MTDTIKVGDRVTWQQSFSSYRRFIRHYSGTVREIKRDGDGDYAVVVDDTDGRLLLPDVDKLVKACGERSESIDASALVAAVAALPQDDQEREQAISDLRRAEL